VTLRPDLVDVWVYRIVDADLQILMLRRSSVKVLPGLWQGVSGSIDPGERVVDAALRELREETGFVKEGVRRLSTLDFVASFLWEPLDAVMSSVHFAAEVPPDAQPRLSREHDAFEWLPADDAIARSAWPGYREAITRVRECLLDPDRAPWFRLVLD
jgi:8-oxo-dGTP pyrophosphatase MutT (NUDIX family)